MKILVRLPNWLGDMVMSVGFVNQLHNFFPGAQVSFIAKKGIHELLSFFPPHEHHFIFDRNEYKGFSGLLKFGHTIRNKAKFDLFFCLPDSLSSAIMGAATGARQRVGYKKELRQLLLTHSFNKPEGLHRVEEYIQLLSLFTHRKAGPVNVSLKHSFQKENFIVVNINSEASSRRLTVSKAVEVLTEVVCRTERKIIMIGAPKERDFAEQVIHTAGLLARVENRVGTTNLSELAEILARAQAMLSTDSGPAHLCNALGTPVVVLFGAGNEKNTAPYDISKRTVIRLGKLSCEPCQKNICVRYAVPQCLEQLNSSLITDNVLSFGT
jgi:ADP-heptose:LPS heptosyltransferase